MDNIENIENYLFFGHQNRFKSYIVDTFNSLLVENKIDEETRFSNGAILCLDITWYSISVLSGTQQFTNPNKSSTYWRAKLNLSLIYDGDKLANKKNEPYWVVDSDSGSDSGSNLIKFEKKEIDISEGDFKSIFKIDRDVDKKHIRCYFVRHGFSEHNKDFFDKNPLATNTSLIGLDIETRTAIETLLTYINNPSLFVISTPESTSEISLEDFRKLPIYDTLIRNELITDDKIKKAFDETNNNESNESKQGTTTTDHGDDNNDGWRTFKTSTTTISDSDIGAFLENILNEIYIKKNGELQSILAGNVFSKILPENETIKAVFVSDLVRTQETAGFFLSQLTNNNQLNPSTPIIVLPCLHELANGEKDGDQTRRKAFSQATRIFTLGTTQGVMNRENNTNCREDNKSYFKKDCSTIKVGNKVMYINWELYKIFYKGYRDENKWGRKECKDHHFLGIFFENFVSDENFNNSQVVVANRIEEGGRRKRRQTKKQRVMKSKKVRRAKKNNKKSKKVKRRSNKRKA